MIHIGRIIEVKKNNHIKIDDIQPSIRYKPQIPADAKELLVKKGQMIQFELDKNGNPINIKILNQDNDKNEPPKNEETTTEKLEKMRQEIKPIEFYSYITQENREEPTDWLYQNRIHIARYAKSNKNADILNDWKDWILDDRESRATTGIKGRKIKLGNLYNSMTIPQFDLHILPRPSFAISFQFTLIKPYISRGEESLYPTENPIVKDHTIGLPTIRETSWKGHLRQAMRESLGLFNDKNGEIVKELKDDENINRLFGTRNKESKDLKQGYLHFYPTYFDKISLEVINPHNREKRAGTIPITFESVPIGATGNFFLLYTPTVGFTRSSELSASKLKEINCIIDDAQNDLIELVKAIRGMFTIYGFSAKALSGYGLADEGIQCVDEIPMLQTNSKTIAPELPWETGSDGNFFIKKFGGLTNLGKLTIQEPS